MPKSTKPRVFFLICAKLLEHFDRLIAEALQVIGGHPIKHLAAAAGCLLIDLALFDNLKQSAQTSEKSAS